MKKMIWTGIIYLCFAVSFISCKSGGAADNDKPPSKNDIPNPVLDANSLVDYTKW